ncbi:hypothetical protein ANCCAN_03633 [Ancylostoma caninum]|uniref:Uncharacterized protein n=1 Tax=Ancylostoma caninum TaxID=29170 RepID=A0A368H0U7_ANCCA|nr:hypothetical protein ANCCAN_03633 [Ancylostoma caninum]
MGAKDEKKQPEEHSLHFTVNHVPDLGNLALFGFQQMMLCLSGLLVIPFLQSNLACAGSATIELRVRLIAVSFFTSGIATILQTTFGLRFFFNNYENFPLLNSRIMATVFKMMQQISARNFAPYLKQNSNKNRR